MATPATSSFRPRILAASACAAAALLLICASGPGHATEPAAGTKYFAVQKGLLLSKLDAEKSMFGGTVLLQLPTAATDTFLDHSISTRTGSSVYVVASSAFLTFAVVKGSASIDGINADAGSAVVVSLDTAVPERMDYDARALSETAPPAIRTMLRADLAPVIEKQRRSRFWGLLGDAGVNARATGSPQVEAARSQFLMTPALFDIRARRKPGTAGSADLTLDRFSKALGSGDVLTVAELLDPMMFLDAGEGWRDTRFRFAQSLVRQRWASELKTASVAKTDSPSRFHITTASGALVATVATHDGATFVSGLEVK